MKDIKAVKVEPYQLDFVKNLIIPQPTRFWILDKSLRSAISKLEEKGYIRQWEEKVSRDRQLFEFFVKLHQIEIEERRKIIKDLELPEYVVKKLTQTGIGGIEGFKKKPFKVKCLHLWTAYHLGDNRFKNPIGKFVLDKIENL